MPQGMSIANAHQRKLKFHITMIDFRRKDLRQWGEHHINKSLKQINDSSWLVGDLILRRLSKSSEFTAWNDDDGSSFSLTVAQKPLPATTAIDSPHINLIYECGDASAIWSIGHNAICKARFTRSGVTPESTTLKYVHERGPTTFRIPEVFYHAYTHDRNFLFLQKFPGVQLFKLWPTLDQDRQQAYCDKIVCAIQEMERWIGTGIGGVDGQGIPDNWLLEPKTKQDFTPENLQASCEQVRMDCSDLVFLHNDLAAVNIIVENGTESVQLNIIDFELAGFLPKVWSRTKFAVCGAFNVDMPRDYPDQDSYRKMMENTLGALGYDDVANVWRVRYRQAFGLN